VYLRFVFARTRDRSRLRHGILHDARGGSDEETAFWLNLHLPVPPKRAFSGGRGLCWFKVDAHPCIDRVRDLALRLEGRGERIWQIYSRNPGLITYADEFQVVAVPDSVRLRV